MNRDHGITVDPSEIAAKIKSWGNKEAFREVSIKEIETPEVDPNYESRISKEIKFEPKNPKALQLEFWIADNGFVGFGVDRLNRVAGIQGIQSESKRFVAGREPSCISLQVLEKIFTLVANGRVEVAIVSVPLFGIVSSSLIISQEDLISLKKLGFQSVESHFKTHASSFARRIKFEPWT